MRYRLRTLLILLAIGPPMLARLWTVLPWGVSVLFVALFAWVLFCLACGWIWLTIMRAIEPYLNQTQR